MTTIERARAEANHARFAPGTRAGHYESFFLRANHPSRPLAFWIRYTLFSPKDRPEAGIGELWAVSFDGERGVHVAVKREVPIRECRFARDRLDVAIADARLDGRGARGESAAGGHRLAWDLTCAGGEPPLFLLPLALYDAPLPKAKSLVGLPLATFAGRFTVDGQDLPIDGWVGSQNHNWGSKHTDQYAWCQVAGFDDDADAFLEAGNARLRLGPVWSPWMTPVVLRHRGREIAMNGLVQAARAQGSHRFFEMRFATRDDAHAVEGVVRAEKEDFVGLRYLNPPGGDKTCLNSKLASCQVTLRDLRSGEVVRLATKRRAALEILTEDPGHGVPVLF
jgi:hypothetical protein